MAGFHINTVEPQGSATRILVIVTSKYLRCLKEDLGVLQTNCIHWIQGKPVCCEQPVSHSGILLTLLRAHPCGRL